MDDRSIETHPLGNATSAASRSQEHRCLRVHKEVVHLSAPEPSDLEAVLETFCGQDCGARSATLEDGVSTYRRAMHESLHITRGDTGEPDRGFGRGADAIDQARRGGRHLGSVVPASL